MSNRIVEMPSTWIIFLRLWIRPVQLATTRVECRISFDGIQLQFDGGLTAQ